MEGQPVLYKWVIPLTLSQGRPVETYTDPSSDFRISFEHCSKYTMRSIASSVFALLSVIASPVLAETTHGLVVFSRHGDRKECQSLDLFASAMLIDRVGTSKFFKGYDMTTLGENQIFDSGSFYRARYIEDGASHQILGIAPDKYKASQIWASAPDQIVSSVVYFSHLKFTAGNTLSDQWIKILLHTATDFLQGLYPPLEGINQDLAAEKLTNGTEVSGPLQGYQFVWIHGESEEEPDTIWIKGDDECPAFNNASKSYTKSDEYLSTLESSRQFYSQFTDPLKEILPPQNVTYQYAFEVFDLLNVGKIHNASVAKAISDEDLDQLRYYADQAELAYNYNKTMPARSIGGQTLSGGILRQLDQTVSFQGKLKFSLMAGSYDTMLSFFGLTNLTDTDPNFHGLPDYGSTLAFELFTEADMDTFPSNVDDLQVRFLFRNGTRGELKAFPLFGRSEETMSYDEFKTELGGRAISDPKDWCSRCQSEADFCSEPQFSSSSDTGAGSGSGSSPTITASDSDKSGLTVAQAGVVGAMTTLGVVLLLAGLFFLLSRRKRRSAGGVGVEKRPNGSE